MVTGAVVLWVSRMLCSPENSHLSLPSASMLADGSHFHPASSREAVDQIDYLDPDRSVPARAW